MSDGFWHEAQQNEWLTKIAHIYGIADWNTIIWSHPNNAALAEKRDPNILYPGDRVFIPSPIKKEVEGSTGQRHKFILKTAKDTFLLRVIDSAEKPIAHQKWELVLGQQKFTGMTDEHGDLSIHNVSPEGQHVGNLVFPQLHLAIPVQLGRLNPQLRWNARPFLYQLGTIKLVVRGAFDGTRQEAYGRADCEPAAAG